MLLFGFILLSVAFASKKPKETFIFANNKVVPHDQYDSTCVNKGLEVANLTTISKALLDELAGYPEGKAWIYSIQGNDFGGAPIWIDKNGRITILLKSNSKTKALKRLALCQNIPQPAFFNTDVSSSYDDHDTQFPQVTTPLSKNESERERELGNKNDGKYDDIKEVLKQVEESIDGKRGNFRKPVTLVSSEEDSQGLPEPDVDEEYKDTGRRIIVKLPENKNEVAKSPPTTATTLKPPVPVTKDLPVFGNKANKPRPTTTKVALTAEQDPEAAMPLAIITSQPPASNNNAGINQVSANPQPKIIMPSSSSVTQTNVDVDPEISHDNDHSSDEHSSESEERNYNHTQVSDEAHTIDENEKKTTQETV